MIRTFSGPEIKPFIDPWLSLCGLASYIGKSVKTVRRKVDMGVFVPDGFEPQTGKPMFKCSSVDKIIKSSVPKRRVTLRSQPKKVFI